MRGSHSLSMLLCALLFAGPAAAQDQRGGYPGRRQRRPGGRHARRPRRGTQRDRGDEGRVDDDGHERELPVPVVQPGVYEIDATIAGFKPGKITEVHVCSARFATVDFTLPVATRPRP